MTPQLWINKCLVLQSWGRELKNAKATYERAVYSHIAALDAMAQGIPELRQTADEIMAMFAGNMP